MKDLEKAKKILKRKNLKLAIVKNKRLIFSSKKPGLKGLILSKEELGEKLQESTVGDKIVGRAASLLCVNFGVREVYGNLMSKKAIKTLQNYNLKYKFEKKIESIKSEKGESCTYEKILKEDEDPSETYRKLKKKIL